MIKSFNEVTLKERELNKEITEYIEVCRRNTNEMLWNSKVVESKVYEGNKLWIVKIAESKITRISSIAEDISKWTFTNQSMAIAL